jgi:CubicO group peptidase (beta-lactamase class C family)
VNLSLPAVHPLSPQARERGVTLDNWAEPPNVRWSFLHLEEILATQSIPASSDPEPLAAQLDPALLSVTTPRYDATGRIVRHTSVAEVLADTDTDGFALLHHGRIRLETYADSMTPDTRHLLMSVTKTVVGVIAATLVEEGWFGFDTLVEEVVPGLRDSGFGGATVRDLLDMRSGVRFSETYHDPDADVYLMEHATQWRSPREDVPSTLHDFLRSLPRDRPHGGTFHYRSSETDALAWVCEAATGTGLAQLIHDHVWQPMGGSTRHTSRSTGRGRRSPTAACARPCGTWCDSGRCCGTAVFPPPAERSGRVGSRSTPSWAPRTCGPPSPRRVRPRVCRVATTATRSGSPSRTGRPSSPSASTAR